MKARLQRNPPHNRQRSNPIRWKRLIIFLIVTLVLAYGTLLIILASGNVISNIWFYVLGPAITLIGIILTLYPLVFSSSHGHIANNPSPTQQATSDPSTTHSNIPKPEFPFWNVH